jgi:hypothetical protein
MRRLGLVAILLVAELANAAVALDSFSNSSCGDAGVACLSGGTTLSYPLTVGAGSDRALAVATAIVADFNEEVTGVTFNGISLTRVLARTSEVGSEKVDLWVLPIGTPPPSGTFNVVVTAGPTGPTAIRSGAFSVTGVDPVTPFTGLAAIARGFDGVFASGEQVETTLKIPSSGPNDLVISYICNGDSIVSTPQTQRWINNTDNSSSCNNDAGATAPGGATSLSWRVEPDHGIFLAASFKAVAGTKRLQKKTSMLLDPARSDKLQAQAVGAAAPAIWVAGGEDGIDNYRSVYKSTDGISWTTVSATALPVKNTDVASLVHNGLMWILGGADMSLNPKNVVWYSSDGSTWTVPSAPGVLPAARRNAVAVVFKSKMWVIGGSSSLLSTSATNTVYSSADGSSWATETVTGLGARTAAVGAVLGSKIWLIGGKDATDTLTDTIYSSTDGVNWSLSGTFPQTLEHGSAIAHDGYIWVAVGANQSLYRSANGTTWTRLTDLPASQLAGSLASLGGFLYFISGNNLADVYRYDAVGDTWFKTGALPAARGWPGALTY